MDVPYVVTGTHFATDLDEVDITVDDLGERLTILNLSQHQGRHRMVLSGETVSVRGLLVRALAALDESAAERSGGVRPPVDPAVSGGAGSDHGAGAPAPLKVVPG